MLSRRYLWEFEVHYWELEIHERSELFFSFPRFKVAAEEKLRALQGKEAELQQLRQSLRDRDRLIEKINSAVLESEEKNKVSQEQRRSKK